MLFFESRQVVSSSQKKDVCPPLLRCRSGNRFLAAVMAIRETGDELRFSSPFLRSSFLSLTLPLLNKCLLIYLLLSFLVTLFSQTWCGVWRWPTFSTEFKIAPFYFYVTKASFLFLEFLPKRFFTKSKSQHHASHSFYLFAFVTFFSSEFLG